MMGGLVRRPVPALAEEHPEASKLIEWYDVLGIDSPHDYDPVWQTCRELRIAPSFHNGARSILLRNSPSNFCYNHIGHFASAGHALCKALFFGGVTRRFPDLNFAFLEGGVGWASILLADLIGHWEKRNPEGLENTKPGNLDRARLLDRFAPRFYFGCEADDPTNAWAFNRKMSPMGARLNTLFSSDIGHFDVPDMAGVVPEAYEMVEHGLITDDDFRDFMFENAVRFWGEVNPDFFKGTVVEKAAAEVLTRRAP
jgi:predicted TIM-barrel fold metal-dependent hydrolase